MMQKPPTASSLPLSLATTPKPSPDSTSSSPGLPPSKRRQIGHLAEESAARWLTGRGYSIRDRNFTVRGGELDIVAIQGELLVFVEVRARTAGSHGEAAATITPRKRARLIHAARHWLYKHDEGGYDLRFDVIAVELEEGAAIRFDHLIAAFRLDE